MPADREPPSAADYVFTGVSPALIMLMVGSLVFFLITVLPTGEYKERLLYTSFFFVFGAVLVARIAIQVDPSRATMYGIGLAIVTFLAMSAYVDYPSGTTLKSAGWLVNIGLMALIWWSAHKLTWDCTHVDENRDASGRGLLTASGLTESPNQSTEADSRSQEPATKPTKRKKGKKSPKPESEFSAWTGRWWKHHDAQKGRPHTPGVWVIYFSLAALPLFAIGQSLIPSDDDGRRRATFFQMAVYVGSGLGLLVTTSLLGLRRYLRQRKARMPGSLTASWLGLGAMLIAMFLVVGAFLPRPYSEMPWFGLPQAEKTRRDASNYAKLGDSQGKGDGAAGDKSGRDAKGSGDSKVSRDAERSADSKGDSKDSHDAKGGADSKDSRDAKEGSDSKGDSKVSRDAERSADSRRAPGSNLGSMVEKLAGFLKWLVIAIVVILVVVGIGLAMLRYLAPFTAWARNLLDALKNWWANLFGKKTAVRPTSALPEALRGPPRPPPFTEYSNPFADGSAEDREPAELVRYTFEALDAWAWDRDFGRQASETPLEFTARLGMEFSDFEKSLRCLANLYARVVYAHGPLPNDCSEFLEQFWEQLVHGVDLSESSSAVMN